MNKFLIGAVGMVAMATPASAADLAARPLAKIINRIGDPRIGQRSR